MNGIVSVARQGGRLLDCTLKKTKASQRVSKIMEVDTDNRMTHRMTHIWHTLLGNEIYKTQG
jgi:hypothetical protein